MKSNLQKMARSGMKGRKKDTRVLTVVIAMSFLFLTVGTLLLSSLTETQARQRRSLYGSWQFFYDATSGGYAEETLFSQPWVQESHAVTILGQDDQAGTVSVWDGNFAEMGGLKLIEGRAPENNGEIVLEKGQLSLYGEDVGVGSTVMVALSSNYDYPRLEQRPDSLPETLTVYGVEVEAKPFYQQCGNDITGEYLQGWLTNHWDELRKYQLELWVETEEVDESGWPIIETVYEPLFPEEISQKEDITLFTQEEYQQILDCLISAESSPLMNGYIINNRWYNGIGSNIAKVYHPQGSYNTVSWKMDSKYFVRTSTGRTPDDEYMFENGGIEYQQLTLSQECTVVGILESTADRWDVGNAQAPNSYISQTSADCFRSAVDYLCAQTGAERLFADAQYVLDAGRYLFFSGSGSIREGYANLNEIPFNVMEQTAPESFYSFLLNEDGIPMAQLPLDSDPVSEELKAWVSEQLPEGESAVTIFYVSDLYDYYTVLYSHQTEELTAVVEPIYFCMPQIGVIASSGSVFYVDCEELLAYYYDAQGQVCRESVSKEAVLEDAWAPEGYTPVGIGGGSLEDAYAYNNATVRVNRYGWPMEQSLSQTMGTTVIGVIMVITVCAVFQIFFTQLRRRTRKLTLLRSVGATNGQIFRLLSWEGLYITAASLVLGDLLGVLIAWLITTRLNDTVFYADVSLFLAGQLCGLLAVAAGMMIPSIRAIRAPLVGRMEGKKRRHVKVKAMKRQTWRRICARDRTGNLGRTFGTGGLCIFLVTMELICVFLGNAAFDTYRNTVVKTDCPDYVLELNHAGSERKREEIDASLTQAEGIARADFYRMGEHLFLWYDKIEESPVLNALREVAEPFETSVDSGAAISEPGLITQIYALDENSDLFARLTDAITEGSLNLDRFINGEEVIMLMPMYCELSGEGQVSGDTMREVLYSAKKMDLSLDKSTADVWKRDESIQAGDTITVGVDDMRIVDTTYVYTQQTQQVKVGAVIRYFPDQGVWPFSGDVQSHVVIGSRKLMASMYGDGFTTYENEDMEWMDARISAFNLTSYGRAYYSLYAEQDAAMETTLSPVIRVAREFSMILRNNKDANQAVYDKALSSCLLVGTLAFAATLIVWMILSNTLASAQEQGRKRTGILQALGITRGQLIRSQAAQAVGYWLVTVVAANTLLAAVVLISGAVQRSGQGLGLIQLAQMILREDLVGYPWLLHGVLCLLELPVLLIFHLRAVRIPLKYSPVENIRS